ncbi:succinate dehydrogenase, cytochrome b556 subunit [Fodinicurvata halophila]|uniref:Succinate dehydrogenase cytochrome b556 subunit n=1 Tax=Fodinicurvata halophila TaxID=1419723 RepID=A0ABV8UKN5_9PROT
MSADHRPLSPHLQVYKPQLTSVMSILHRLTGIALAVGTLLLVYWLAAAAGGPESYAAAQAFIASPIGLILLFVWTLAFFYHLCNGIRHLFWDAGYGFELPTVYKSGWAVLIATVVLTLLSWAIGLAVM